MNNQEPKDSKYISNLLRRIKFENDKFAKQILLEEYYRCGYKWAKSLINNAIYNTLITPTEGEIASIIYVSFERAVKHIRIGEDGLMSFKNFFFLMIKWQVYSDLKTTLNYKVVPRYITEVSKLQKDIEESSEREQIHNINMQDLFQKIIEFLDSRNPEYSKIFVLKAQGYKNPEICQKLSLSEMALKARIQYFRKLIRENFGNYVENF